MASVVLYTKVDKARFGCGHCMDKSDMLAQGRTQEYADDRIKRRLIAKGCLSDSKNVTFRLNDGERIYRCPRAICNETDSIAHYSQFTTIKEGIATYDANRQPWKWHQVIKRVRYEIIQVRKLEAQNRKPAPTNGGR